jgi:hypothetical protein
MMTYRRRVFLLVFFLAGLILGPLVFLGPNEIFSSPGAANKGRLFLPEKQEETAPLTLEPLSLEAYWRLVEETRELVASLEGTTPETARTQLTGKADEWLEVTAVSIPDGDTVDLNHAVLEVQLRADPPDLEALAALLDTILATRDSWPEPVHTAAAIASLDEILNRSEFQWTAEEEAEPDESPDFLTRILEFLSDLFPDVNLNIGGDLFGSLIGILSAVILAVALFMAMRGLFMDFIVEREFSEDGQEEDELLTAETALKRAQTLSTGGDYRMAVRYLYLSTLLIMEERGLFRYDRSKTNREYLRSLKGRPEMAATLRDVVDVFDRVWYGFQPLSQSDYSQYQTRVEALKRQQ